MTETLLFLLIMLLLLGLLLVLSFTLSERAYPLSETDFKARLICAVRRIAHAQKQIRNRSEQYLLILSLLCCLLSFSLLSLISKQLLMRYGAPTEELTLVTCRFAPLVLLGLLTLLQIAGEVSLAVTERRRVPSMSLILNASFWLPLLLAWAAVVAYLPIDSSYTVQGGQTSLWLIVIQPAGTLVFFLAWIGPYLLINADPDRRVSPVQNWIRELRMLIGLQVLAPLVISRTCFSPFDEKSTGLDIGRVAIQGVIMLVLLVIVIRLKVFLQRRRGFDPERLWKLTLWLALIALTASFLAFHLLGMSDPLMHVLLNFSLLAIWAGFLLPKANLKLTTTVKNNSTHLIEDQM
ncbi:hypothetical protein [Gimesia maris]|uniref:hypothetical protein n=1 Tax=Gimesia maris TaxID=122 RepID=UPI00241C7D82|nr:hypothetical protein [Gimesia maris]|tara:strand:+ start:705 stop:1754 length:1050 start_codon:yes stop_codon:yes gene_type:complete